MGKIFHDLKTAASRGFTPGVLQEKLETYGSVNYLYGRVETVGRFKFRLLQSSRTITDQSKITVYKLNYHERKPFRFYFI